VSKKFGRAIDETKALSLSNCRRGFYLGGTDAHPTHHCADSLRQTGSFECRAKLGILFDSTGGFMSSATKTTVRRRPGDQEQLQIQYRDPKTLKENPHNARTHSHRQLMQLQTAMKRFPFTNPIQVDENGQIIAGHARRAAAIALGRPTVPVIVLSGLSEPARRALALADNKLALNADWDTETLAKELTFLSEVKTDFDFTVTGFETAEIDNLLVAADESGVVGDEDNCPAPLKTAVSRLGDRFALGSHVVVCGDAREQSSYALLLGKERARMAFLGTPYNVTMAALGKKRHRPFVMASGEMSSADFTSFLQKTLTLAAEHCDDGAILFVCMDRLHIRELYAAGDAAKLKLKNLIVWLKTNAGMGAFYRNQFELIGAFKSGSKPHVNNFGLGDTGRHRSNVWKCAGFNTFRRGREAELNAHPTPMPVALVADAIRDVSHRGDIVLDSFGGSGTTLIAAEKTGRRARLIELDPLYVDVIIRRWEALTGKDAVHSPSGKTFAQLAAARRQR
jgi:DNA modification methylase